MIKTIDKEFVLVNVFNANTDNEEMPTLTELNKMLSNVSDTSFYQTFNHRSCLNFHFYLILEKQDVYPSLKRYTIGSMIE